MRLLMESNINPLDPTSDNLPMFHRRFEHTENDDGNSYCDSILAHKAIERHRAGEDDDAPARDFAVAVAARVINAFDCIQSPDVNIHADCMRLAIGLESVGTQKEVAQRHRRTKQFIHAKVDLIQKRLGIGKSCFNRHFR